MPKESDNSFGVASVIFGILSVTLSFTVILGGFFGILAFIFALVQRKHSKNKWSTAGIVLSAIGVVLAVLMLIAIISLMSGIQQTIQQCTANPNAPGCQEILQVVQPQTYAK